MKTRLLRPLWHRTTCRIRICALACLIGVAALASPMAAFASDTAVPVEVREVDGRWQLYRNRVPYYIRGAGLEFGDIAALAANGGNSFRTWRTDNGRLSGQEILDIAQQYGLTVAMGIDVGCERHGFDYDDEAAVTRQLDRVRNQVLAFKDHPALLMWVIGNELNLHASNPKVWDAVNDISLMIHDVDGCHPTMTAVAGIGPELADDLRMRAPDLDLIGIQMYADIVNLPRYLRESGWTGPYVVTEWGATGHWEVGKTAWGAPVENNSSVKADLYQTRYDAVIRPDQKQCLGSYVFLWGQKQERTPTWYGMFLESGEATETVDVMHHLWTGTWPSNRSPALKGLLLDSKTAQQNVRLQAGRAYSASVVAEDPDGDPVTYEWTLMEESQAQTTGGDWEAKPRTLHGRIDAPAQAEVTLTAPDEPGAYRLFVYVHDGHEHSAHANIPFYVEATTVKGNAPRSADQTRRTSGEQARADLP